MAPNQHKAFFDKVTASKDLERFDAIYYKIVALVDSHEDESLLEFMDACAASNPDRGVLRTVLMTLKSVKTKIPGLEAKFDHLHDMLKK